MGHAFDPKGHDAICDAVDWTLAQARLTWDENRSSGMAD
jgi:uncharacterized protein YsxB (DUF464 family)